jgi:hypothetical protein
MMTIMRHTCQLIDPAPTQTRDDFLTIVNNKKSEPRGERAWIQKTKLYRSTFSKHQISEMMCGLSVTAISRGRKYSLKREDDSPR